MKYLLLILALFVYAVPAYAYDKTDVVAAVIIAEAGGEGYKGMQAVANVIANRATIQKKTPYEIVVQPKQFSCISPVLEKEMTFEAFIAKHKKHKRWNDAKELTRTIYFSKLEDVTGGARNFHSGPKPYWAKKMTFTVRIGGHSFYR